MEEEVESVVEEGAVDIREEEREEVTVYRQEEEAQEEITIISIN